MTATLTSPARRIDLIERVSAGGRIDKATATIFGVKVLGAKSLNGRTYSPRALATAARLYEGVAVNVDHPTRDNPGRERGVMEQVGELRNCRVAGDGVVGDLRLFKNHPSTLLILELAEEAPHRIGLSHNAIGNVVNRGGAEVVEEIESVRSVDLVTRPATNSSLFESANSEGGMDSTGGFTQLDRGLSDFERSCLKVIRDFTMPVADKIGVLKEFLTAQHAIEKASGREVAESFSPFRVADQHVARQHVPRFAGGEEIANYLRG